MSTTVDTTLYQKITDICFENGGVTKPMVDKIMNLITLQTIEAYKKGYIDGGIAELTNPIKENN